MEEIDLENPMGALLSNFRTSQIVASLVFSVIGIYLWRHGKKVAEAKLTVIAIILLIYPMFTSSWILDWSVGIALCALAYYLNENRNLTG